MNEEDAELERFKTDISLIDFAVAEFGFEIVKEKSSKAFKFLKSGGDRLLVIRKEDGHDFYLNANDDRDRGSIIDLVKSRKNINLGQVRKELRPWIPGAQKPANRMPNRPPERPVTVTKNRADVLKRWSLTNRYDGSYLTSERCLDSAIIGAFGVREDSNGNACFKHQDRDGVCGWEIKNMGFTRFCDGGSKGLFVKRLDVDRVKRIVIVEAAIDALSYSQMEHQAGNMYVSTGGSLGEHQRELLKLLLIKNVEAELVLAQDNDAIDKNGSAVPFDQRAGEKMAQKIAGLAPSGMTVVRLMPEKKDWNDVLRDRTRTHERGKQLHPTVQRNTEASQARCDVPPHPTPTTTTIQDFKKSEVRETGQWGKNVENRGT